MTRQEAVNILLEHFSEGLVRTLEDAIAKKEREECAKACEEEKDIDGISTAKAFAEIIRARGQK